MRRLLLFLVASEIVLMGDMLRTSSYDVHAQAPAGTSRIVANVVLTGTAPAQKKIQFSADPVCAQLHQSIPGFTQEVEVGAGGALKDTLVYIKDGMPGTYPVPSTPATLDQVGCIYTPHVLGVMAGQPVQIINSDETLHNIHPLPVINAGFNIGMPRKGLKSTKVFSKPEPPFHVRCDVHPWMSAYIGVFSNPFFGVSNEQGEVELKNLPAGTFQVQAWHEKYGVRIQTVTVVAGETKQLTFTFKAQ